MSQILWSEQIAELLLLGHAGNAVCQIVEPISQCYYFVVGAFFDFEPVQGDMVGEMWSNFLFDVIARAMLF